MENFEIHPDFNDLPKDGQYIVHRENGKIWLEKCTWIPSRCPSRELICENKNCICNNTKYDSDNIEYHICSAGYNTYEKCPLKTCPKRKCVKINQYETCINPHEIYYRGCTNKCKYYEEALRAQHAEEKEWLNTHMPSSPPSQPEISDEEIKTAANKIDFGDDMAGKINKLNWLYGADWYKNELLSRKKAAKDIQPDLCCGIYDDIKEEDIEDKIKDVITLLKIKGVWNSIENMTLFGRKIK